MRVLMLGWDFSPRLSGGVGSACQGLAGALARADGSLRTEVVFVLPRLRGDEEPEDVRLLASDASAALSSSSTPALPAQATTRAPAVAARVTARTTAHVLARARAHT
ncbi:MAG: hypothetical protein HOP15_16695, partial [Planctomycetes bacterium]|nr:hypothetical protein [Planctomycetota bacterium]